jgi:hypothetical protein
MVLPFIASISRDVFEAVPPVLKEAAYGIGCTTWEVFRNIVLPYTRVGVIGNHRDRSVPWVDTVWTLVDGIERDAPWRSHKEAQVDVFRDQEWFTPPIAAMFSNEQRLTPEQVVDRMRSISHVAALGPEPQREFLDEIRRVLATDTAPAGAAELTLPYRTDVCWTERA